MGRQYEPIATAAEAVAGQKADVASLVHKLRVCLCVGLAAAIVLGSIGACSRKGRTHSTPAETNPAANAAIAGTWSGQTKVDGTLTLTIQVDGKLSYSFSGGCREKGEGEYTIEDEEIYYCENPSQEDDEVVWRYSLDGGNLKLTMEDSPEEYVLSRQ